MGLDNPLHIAVIVVLVLLVFGAKRLPEIGRSLGSGMREFKESVTGESKPTLGAGEQAPPPPVAQPPQPAATQAVLPDPQPASVAGSDRPAPPGAQTPGSA
jgi:sec-independent protein translocase protein TatA